VRFVPGNYPFRSIRPGLLPRSFTLPFLVRCVLPFSTFPFALRNLFLSIECEVHHQNTAVNSQVDYS
jgi:hypothetical protein